MAEIILVVGHSCSEFNALKATAPKNVVYERADSPLGLITLSKQKHYDCIFCNASVLDSIPYICAMRSVQTIPIFIGSIQQYKTINQLKCYTEMITRHNHFAEAGNIRMDFDGRIVHVSEQEISLTSTEFDLLSLLISNPKRVFTYEMIADIVWNEDCTFYTKKVIHNHISNIKKKLQAVSPHHKYIISVHGIGYKFSVEPMK